MNGLLEGKVVLVTGASSGIGRATAILAAREGARVMASDVNDEGGMETVALIHQALAAAGRGEHVPEGRSPELGPVDQADQIAAYVHCDVSRPEEVERLVRETVARFGRLDGAVNNAGIEGVLAVTAEYPQAVWDRVLSINLTGVFLGLLHQIPTMLETGGGSIVNVSSILGLVGFAQAPAYTAAKHGVIGLTKVAAQEYAERGVRVNAVCPAFIETPMVMERSVAAGSHPEVYDQIAALHPVGRLGRPEEIAEAIVWLLSDRSSFVTGHALAADGGYLTR